MTLWTPSSVLVEEWGRIRVVVGGRNVTTFRGAETIVPGWSDQEPYGAGPAQLVFPSITELDLIGTGDLSWLRGGPSPSDVDIYRVAPDGTRDQWPLWSGYVKRFTLSNSVNDGQLTAECSGAVQGSLSLLMHQPRQSYKERDIGLVMIRDMRHVGTRIGPFAETETGILTRKRGSRGQTSLDFLDELLNIAVTDDGDQWTLQRDLDTRRSVALVLKDRTTVDITVHAGARGVELNLSQDFTEEPNRIFGEGVGKDGDRWRGLVLPNLKPETAPTFPGSLSLGDTGDDVRVWQGEVHSDGHDTGDKYAYKNGEFGELEEDAAKDIQRAAGLTVTGIVDAATWAATWANGRDSANLNGGRFDPIAADDRTVRWLLTSNGSLSAPNPGYDHTVLPVEQLVSYGEGMSKRRARRHARAQLARYGSDPGWVGTVVLRADPIEMHRLDIVAGMNVRIKFFGGSPSGILAHISDVSPSLEPGLPVTLTVDTKARDQATIAELLVNDRESRQDPARNFLNQRRRSAHVRDTVTGWDKESGMGIFPDRELAGGEWTVLRVPANHFGSILSTELTVDPSCKFYAAVFGARVSASKVATLNPTPGTARTDDYDPWDAPDIQDDLGRSNRTGLRLAMTWGNPGQAAGYWPGEEAKGHSPTGKLRDDASWDYILDPENDPWLYLAVYPASDCTLSGEMKAAVDE